MMINDNNGELASLANETIQVKLKREKKMPVKLRMRCGGYWEHIVISKFNDTFNNAAFASLSFVLDLNIRINLT